MDIAWSARKHGVADPDIRHAVARDLVTKEFEEDPERWLVLGPDRAANLLEVIILIKPNGRRIAIHAMPIRPIHHHLLP